MGPRVLGSTSHMGPGIRIACAIRSGGAKPAHSTAPACQCCLVPKLPYRRIIHSPVRPKSMQKRLAARGVASSSTIRCTDPHPQVRRLSPAAVPAMRIRSATYPDLSLISVWSDSPIRNRCHPSASLAKPRAEPVDDLLEQPRLHRRWRCRRVHDNDVAWADARSMRLGCERSVSLTCAA